MGKHILLVDGAPRESPMLTAAMVVCEDEMSYREKCQSKFHRTKEARVLRCAHTANAPAEEPIPPSWAAHAPRCKL